MKQFAMTSCSRKTGCCCMSCGHALALLVGAALIGVCAYGQTTFPALADGNALVIGMVAGAILLLVGILGLAAACVQRGCTLLVSVVLLFVVGALCIAGLWVSYFYTTGVHDVAQKNARRYDTSTGGIHANNAATRAVRC